MCCFLFAGCKEKTETGSSFKLYYPQYEENVVGYEEYQIQAEVTEDMVLEIVGQMFGRINEMALLPEEVVLNNYEILGDVLKFDFAGSYLSMNSVDEILCRAAIVKTFVQIPGVEYVRFMIDGEDFKDSKDGMVGLMKADSFLESSGKDITAYQNAEVTLYFTNEKGDKLRKEVQSVYYTSNSTIEKVIVEQLIKGPKEVGHYAVIPSTTRIVDVSVANEVAYVNLNKRFVSDALPVEPEVTIYAIVNSLITSGNVKKVHISVNGDSNIVYGETCNLTEMFAMNHDLIQEEQNE